MADCITCINGPRSGTDRVFAPYTFSQQTGQLKLILLDECWLIDMRTAAAGAVTAKHLAPDNAHHIGIVGAGVQARMQLELLKDGLTVKAL